MRCVVCKETRDKRRHQRWYFTSEQSPMSRVSLLFKLYEFTRSEVAPGAVCPTCHQLVAHIDNLEYQACGNEYLPTLSTQT